METETRKTRFATGHDGADSNGFGTSPVRCLTSPDAPSTRKPTGHRAVSRWRGPPCRQPGGQKKGAPVPSAWGGACVGRFSGTPRAGDGPKNPVPDPLPCKGGGGRQPPRTANVIVSPPRRQIRYRKKGTRSGPWFLHHERAEMHTSGPHIGSRIQDQICSLFGTSSGSGGNPIEREGAGLMLLGGGHGSYGTRTSRWAKRRWC